MSLIGTLTSGVSAMQSFTKGLEVIGNNIANVNTTGYKSSQASFADSFSNTLRNSAPSNGTTPNLSATQVGTGVKLSKITARFTQGALQTTGVGSDLGVSGTGYFMVKNSVDSSTYATRAGDFRIDDQGYMVNAQGYRVQGLSGGSSATALNIGSAPTDIRIGQNLPLDAVTGLEIPLQSYSIDKFGNVVEFYGDGSSATTNRVLLQNFVDPTALQKQGNNLYTGFDAAGVVGGTFSGANNSPGRGGLGNIESGTLELSNVDLTEEFANMITTQRSFQASARLITVSDSVLEDIVNLKR